jgi:hypothetical protein
MSDDRTRAAAALEELRAALAEQAAGLEAEERRIADGLAAYVERARPS